MENIDLAVTGKQLIKKCKGIFIMALLLVLIPAIIIDGYSFYSNFKGEKINYSALDSVDIEAALMGDTESLGAIQEAFNEMYPEASDEFTAGDILLEILGIIIFLFFDVFIIVLALNVLFKREFDSTVIIKNSFKRIFSFIVVSLLCSWVLYEVDGMILSGIISCAAAVYLKNYIFMVSFFFAYAIMIPGITLLACWLLLYLHHMAVAVVSGRCRTLLSFGYAREILKGRVWKNIMAFLPYVFCGVTLPFILQSVGILMMENIYIAMLFSALSIVLQTVFSALMWMHITPRFFRFEKESGIQEKIRSMMDNAMNMRNSSQNDNNNNNNNDNNTDDDSNTDKS